MALSKRQADQVAREKERISLRSGDTPQKGRRYADEVRAYAARERAREQSGRSD
jgi:hypothetical protein